MAREALNADRMSDDAADRARAVGTPSGMTAEDVRNLAQGDRGAVRSGAASAAGGFAGVGAAGAYELAKQYLAKRAAEAVEAVAGAGTRLARIFKGGSKGAETVATEVRAAEAIAPTSAARYTAGIEAAEGERLTASIRRSLQLEGRNVAIAEANINGERELLTGVSGKASPAGTVPSPSQGNRLFTWRDSGAQTRAFDSEVKILEHLGQKMPPDATGTVSLFTERPPCTSCGGSSTFNGVIQQFEARFPGVKVIVTHGRSN